MNKRSTLIIDKFDGVDFSSPKECVDLSHSPDALNVYRDSRGYLRKRSGYKVIKSFEKKGNGIFIFPKNGKTELIIHSGTSLFKYSENIFTRIYDTMPDHETKGFLFENRLYILGGNAYICYDGDTVKKVRDIAYIPTTFISRSPLGGGTRLEYPNLLSDNRKNSFLCDGESTEYKLDASDIFSVNEIVLNGSIMPKESYSKAPGGVIVFNTPPPKAENGIDNLVINYNCGTGSVYLDIERCDTFGIYGGKNDSRVFFTGVEEQKNVDFQSGLYDPTYFPSDGYTKLGSSTSEIMGYVSSDGCQIIVKSDNQSGATHFKRKFMLDENSRAYFQVQDGICAAGAVSKSFIDFCSRPLYISKEGVMEITGTDVENRYIVKNVSQKINGKLLKSDISGAKFFSCGDMLFLCAGEDIYFTRSSYYRGGFEWFYFKGPVIKDMCSIDGVIYFLDSENRLCRFEEGYFLDGGIAVEARWDTPVLSLGNDFHYKNIYNFGVRMPDIKSDYHISLAVKNGKNPLFVPGFKFLKLKSFDFNKIDFGNNLFSFCTNTFCDTFFTGIKIHNAENITVSAENKEKNEDFCVSGILIDYSKGKKIL